MDKSFRIIIIILLALAIINIVLIFTEKSNLKEVQRNLEKSQRNIDSAIINLNYSKSRLDSIQSSMETFKYYIKNIQTNVAIINTTKEIEEAKGSAKMKIKLDSLRDKVSELKADLKETDSLPDIQIKSL
ncbi:hypothetical protein SAMN05518672_102520 [Chitinophaga sp. CF118]|uniref:hypothetical protein n=1 Tax=Chitinophaga sp. CF118 TaxID=1884367 RepID=UPI0008F01EEF|nr:hypothetical protein [Chitinophaga sp. CF118]SFD58929.1 hypothetical protein SAMN05518672_102520 [Chitinophaga sp. CF118]